LAFTFLLSLDDRMTHLHARLDDFVGLNEEIGVKNRENIISTCGKTKNFLLIDVI
jgi:hypothetical protein